MKRKIATKDLVLTALFAALTAVLAQIQLPIGPVPFNLAVFGAFLAGMLLEPAWAAASMGVYMLLGAVGIPVFAGFMGGPAVLLGKTGGYVIGYIFIGSGHSAGRQTFGQAACDRGRNAGGTARLLRVRHRMVHGRHRGGSCFGAGLVRAALHCAGRVQGRACVCSGPSVGVPSGKIGRSVRALREAKFRNRIDQAEPHILGGYAAPLLRLVLRIRRLNAFYADRSAARQGKRRRGRRCFPLF